MNRPTHPSAPSDRFEVYRFFNGISADGQDGLSQGYTPIPLVKSFLLEHVSSRSDRTPKKPAAIFEALGAETRPLDDAFLELRVWEKHEGETAPRRKTAGYLEQFD